MFNLNNEIDKWKKTFRKNPSLEDGYIEELEQHLRDVIEECMEKGSDVETAFNEAVKKIGSGASISDEYYKSATRNKFSARPSWRVPRWMPVMIWNYYKVALRNLKRNKGFALINILGLSIGIAVFVLITFYTQNELNYDGFHKDGERIYRLLREAPKSKGAYKIAVTSGPFAPAIKTDFSGVVDEVLRVCPADGLVSYLDQNIWEDRFYLADNHFFNFFSYELLTGNKDEVLNGPNKLVISDETAVKYFGDENPVGKLIKLDNQYSFEVTGVFRSKHPNSHLNFDFVASLQTFEGTWLLDEWWSNSVFTYLKLNPTTDVNLLDYQLDAFMLKYFGDDFAQTKLPMTLTLERLENIYMNADSRYDHIAHGNKTVVIIFSFVAVFVLLIACINFMNLSSAKSVKRAKEIGVRKVIGAQRKSLVMQFISEATIYSLASGAVAALLIIFITPHFENLTASDIAFPIDNPLFYLVSLLFLVFLGFLAGSYPAFVLSGFKPVKALSNEKLADGGSGIRRILVVTQFVISIVLISGVIVVFSQTSFLINKDSGFDKEQVVLIRANSPEIRSKRFELKEALIKESAIKSVSFMSGEPGGFHDSFAFKIEDKGGEFFQMRSLVTDFEYLSLYNVELLHGRNFSEQYSLDSTQAVIINETAARYLDWQPAEAIGKRMAIRFYNEEQYRSVIGVVKDYHFTSLHTNIDPLVIFPANDHRVIAIKIKSDDISSVLNTIEAKFGELIPGFPFQYEFLDETFEANYSAEKKQLSVLSILTVLAITIAVLGLFGLSTHSAESRKKEIGIRKVLGASAQRLIVLLIGNFLKLVLVSNIIAIPVSWYISKHWLSNFAYRTELTIVPFALTLIATVLIALIATGHQTLKAVFMNPVESIKND